MGKPYSLPDSPGLMRLPRVTASTTAAPSSPFPPSRARLGEGGGLGLLDLVGPGDEALRGAVEDLEAHNRKLQAENQRLQVEVVRNDSTLMFSGILPAGRREALAGPVLRRSVLFLEGCINAATPVLQATAQDDAREAAEKMIVAQMQRDRLRQRLQALDPAAAAEAAVEADAIASGTSSAGEVVRDQLERIAELEREVKRLKQVSRWGLGADVGGSGQEAARHTGAHGGTPDMWLRLQCMCACRPYEAPSVPLVPPAAGCPAPLPSRGGSPWGQPPVRIYRCTTAPSTWPRCRWATATAQRVAMLPARSTPSPPWSCRMRSL